MNNFKFNSKFLNQTIDRGIVLLKNPFISHNKRKGIKNEIVTLKNFLVNSFESENILTEEIDQSIECLKKQFLKNMKKQYKTLGRDLIVKLIEKSKGSIPQSSSYAPNAPQFTIEDQIEETLEMYNDNSSLFYTKAKEILSNSQIHVDYDLNSSSWLFYSKILERPLLIVNPSESTSILVSKLQKAIEMSLGFESTYLLEELGSIYFELLYNDQLFSKYKIFSESYFDRVIDFKINLQHIQSYLELLLTFSKTDFKVDTNVFVGEIEDMLGSNSGVINYLNNELYNKNTESNLTYCMSFLKALELRKKNLENKEYIIEILHLYLTGEEKEAGFSEKLFTYYETFLDELEQRHKKI